MLQEPVTKNVLWMGVVFSGNRYCAPWSALVEPRVHTPVHESGSKIGDEISHEESANDVGPRHARYSVLDAEVICTERDYD